MLVVYTIKTVQHMWAFGVKDSLISEYKFVDDIERAKDVGFNTTYYELEFNFVLEKP